MAPTPPAPSEIQPQTSPKPGGLSDPKIGVHSRAVA
jgi:hypothetical protein